jgi:hypothetical protein
MKRQSVFTVLVIVSVLAAAFAIAEHTFGQNTRCERCGVRMRAFMEGDSEREDTDILQCPACGFLLNTRHSMH